MKFIHIADVHLNATPDAGKPWAESRREAIKDTFQSLIARVEDERIPLLLIAGDLFHNQPLIRDLKEINYLFSTIPHTRVVIIAGNHDYLKDTSHYHTFAWASNVTFLTDKGLSCIYFPEINTEVYGFSYYENEILEPLIDNITIPDRDCFQVLLAHGGDERHMPISMQALRYSGFDYIALGHIHKPGVLVENKVAYPGSLEPLNKTEYGQHGYISGEYNNHGVTIKHVPFAKTQYVSLIIHVTPETTSLELNDLIKKELDKRGRHNIYRLRLKGFYDPDIVYEFSQLSREFKIVEILNETEPEYDFEQLYSEHRSDMIGLYIDTFKKDNLSPVEKKALFYGMKALMQTTNEGKS